MDRHASKAFAVSLVIGLDFFSQAAESKDCSLFSREIRLAFYFLFRLNEERVKSLQLVFFSFLIIIYLFLKQLRQVQGPEMYCQHQGIDWFTIHSFHPFWSFDLYIRAGEQMLQDPLYSISNVSNHHHNEPSVLVCSLSYLGTTNYFKLHWAWQDSRKHCLIKWHLGFYEIGLSDSVVYRTGKQYLNSNLGLSKLSPSKLRHHVDQSIHSNFRI